MFYLGGRFVVKFGGILVRDDFREVVIFVFCFWDENEVVLVVLVIKGVIDVLLKFLRIGEGFEWIEKVYRDFVKKYGIFFEIFVVLLREFKKFLREVFFFFEVYRDYVFFYGEWFLGLVFVEVLRWEGI